jgi:integrase
MTGISYLKQRGNAYYARVRVPNELIPVLKRSEVVKALGTSDKVVAKRRLPDAVDRINSMFDALRGGKPLRSEDIEAELQSVVAGLLTRLQEERLSRPKQGRRGSESGQEYGYSDELRDCAAAYWEDYEDDAFSRVRSVATEIIARLGVTAPEGGAAYRELCRGLLVAHAEAYRVELRRFEGNQFEGPKLPINPALIDPLEPQKGAVVFRRRRPAGNGEDTDLSLPDAIELYVTHMGRSDAWTPKTKMQTEASLRMFAAFIGDIPLSDVKRADVAAFKDTLHDLPALYGKSNAMKGRGIRELAEEAKSKGLPTLTMKTVKRHVSALIGLFSWAKSEGKYEGENPAAGFKFPRSKRPNEERPAWTEKQLEKLFHSPVWAGCLSAKERDRPGGVILRDDRYFIPLLGAFSGLRLEEACQLHVSDVVTEDGVSLVWVRPGPGKQLKSKAAVRRVPLHPVLIHAGFLELVAAAREANRTTVFDGLLRGGPDMRFGFRWSQWFTKYRRSIGVYEKGVDFHGLRHSFTTALDQAGVSRSIIDQLTGHEGAGETSRYTKPLGARKLADAVEAVSYGNLKLTHLNIQDRRSSQAV